ARREFLGRVLAAQPGVRLVELGAPARVLESVGGLSFDPDTIRAIGAKYQLDALLVAELRADPMDPYLFIRKARTAAGPVEIAGALEARIFDTRQGEAVWSTSASGSRPITRVMVNAWGLKSVEPGHLQEVRTLLVKDLVAQATADFRKTAPSPLAGR